MNDRFRMTYPEQTNSETADDQFIRDYALRRGFDQVIIIGVNDRNEYTVEVHADNDADKMFASRNLKAITKALRGEGLEPRDI